MPKFGKDRIKNQLSCLIVENPALIPIRNDFKVIVWFYLAPDHFFNQNIIWKSQTWFLNQDMPEINHCSKKCICKSTLFLQHDDYKAHLWSILLASWFKSQNLIVTIENIIFHCNDLFQANLDLKIRYVLFRLCSD